MQITSNFFRKPPRWGCLVALWMVAFARAGEAPPVADTIGIRLPECLERALAKNEDLQSRALEWLATQKQANAAKGIFEPEFVGTADHVDNFRRTTVEQAVTLNAKVFGEQNNLYASGIDFLVPTGGKIHVGYSLRELQNSLQYREKLDVEYVSFAGVTLNQPLLKNAGLGVTMAAIRIAAAESDVAFQTYRRQLILLVSQVESAYWNLALVQEELKILGDSLKTAQTLLFDAQVRQRAGRASELDVLQAESGVATRQALQQQAEQRLVDARSRLVTLLEEQPAQQAGSLVAIDTPSLAEVGASFAASMEEAMESNPDYLTQKKRILQQDIRLAYARNQRWPELDLKASYGLNGLNTTAGGSWDDMTSGKYESWTVGAELRVPLGGGIKSRNEYEAAKLRKKQALLSLKSLETEMANRLDTIIHRMSSYRDSYFNYQKVVEVNQKVLDTERARFEAGRTDSRKVLESEALLSEARRTALQSLTDYLTTMIQWELLKGSTLKPLHLELTRDQVRSKVESIQKSPQSKDPKFLEWPGSTPQATNPPTASHP